MSTENQSITELGIPGKPTGEAGAEMLRRMNQSHYNVTGWALKHFTFKGNERILDIGCGGGETLFRLASLAPQGKLCGVDHSEVSIEESRRRNEELISLGRLELTQASVSDLPFDDNSFDRIITVESFYFWENPANDLNEVFRVLAPGGQFLIVADIYGGAELDEESIQNVKKYRLFNPTPAEFKQLLTGAGFNEVIIHTKSGTTWICAEGRKS